MREPKESPHEWQNMRQVKIVAVFAVHERRFFLVATNKKGRLL